MRKFFLLIPALVLSLFTNAAVINVAPGTNTIRYAIAASTTNDGDVLVLEDGTYTDNDGATYTFNISEYGGKFGNIKVLAQLIMSLTTRQVTHFLFICFKEHSWPVCPRT